MTKGLKEDHHKGCGVMDTDEDPSKPWCEHYEVVFTELARAWDIPIERVRSLAKFVLNIHDTTPGVNFLDIQSNYSALMYIVTEQQALIGNLLQELVKTGQISSIQLNKITDIHENSKVLTPVYNDLYKKFMKYFLKVRNILLYQRLRDLSPERPEGKIPSKGDAGESKDD